MASELAAAEQAARQYLDAALGPRAPGVLRLAGTVAEQPLEDEGPVALFRFDLPTAAGAGAAANAAHYVVVGVTEPNYFPAYGLTADQAYSLHLGTRFMLVMGVARVGPEREPVQAWPVLRLVLESCNPGRAIENVALAALFASENQVFAAYRVMMDGRTFFAVGGDVPAGFYELTQHPPQIALRLHLGQLIRAEAHQAEARTRSAAHAARQPAP